MLTVGQWYRWLTEVSVPVMSVGADHRKWLTSALDILGNPHVEDPLELLKMGVDAIAESQLELEGFAMFSDIAHGATEYDASQPGGPCECRECRGILPMDDICLFRQGPIDDAARQLSTIDLELVASLWDRPLSLYQMSKARKSSIARGQMARDQERKRADDKRTIRDDVFAKHGM